MSIEQLIDDIANAKYSVANDTFAAVFATKINDALESQKAAIAQSMFDQSEDQLEDQEDEEENDEEESEDDEEE